MLDRHRGKGQQQITVKHVTVNADQAVVADTVVGGDGFAVDASLIKADARLPWRRPVSGMINLLYLTGSFFMLEIYDRVLPSRSVPTLI